MVRGAARGRRARAGSCRCVRTWPASCSVHLAHATPGLPTAGQPRRRYRRGAGDARDTRGARSADRGRCAGHRREHRRRPGASGAIGWPDGHTDAWNHVECAMALSACGLAEPARRAYEWLRAAQRPDGSWPKQIAGGRVDRSGRREQPGRLRRRRGLARVSWSPGTGLRHADVADGPPMRSTSCWHCSSPRGEIIWERTADGAPGPLRAADRAARASTRACAARSRWPSCSASRSPTGSWRPASSGTRWPATRRRSRTRAGSRWTGTTRCSAGRSAAPARPRRLAAGWADVRGPRARASAACSDEPWVTGAETCELVLALDAIGDRDRALELFGEVQHLRDTDGAYWTGWQFANQAHFPAERSSWTAAAMILAADALAGATGGAALFRDAADQAGLRRPTPTPAAAAAACPARLACGTAARSGHGSRARAGALQHPQRARHGHLRERAGGQRPPVDAGTAPGRRRPGQGRRRGWRARRRVRPTAPSPRSRPWRPRRCARRR